MASFPRNPAFYENTFIIFLGDGANISPRRQEARRFVKPISFFRATHSRVRMKRFLFVLGAAGMLVLQPSISPAQDRYAELPPLVVSPDLSAPWVMQLRRSPEGVMDYRPAPRVRRRRVIIQHSAAPARVEREVRAGRMERQVRQPSRTAIPNQTLEQLRAEVPARVDLRNSYVVPGPRGPNGQRTAAIVPMYTEKQMEQKLAPQFLPRIVDYQTKEKPGTIVIDTRHKFLYLVEPGGKARRYGVGVGKEGFGWTGTNLITRKAEWPGWTPPKEMIAREKAKGRILPAHMEGGISNPLGARALYLGHTLYRIHGTNAPWTIGHNVSSGCIRMRNQDVVDLYGRVHVGTKVVVM
jgi:lipoprotein-anchoring transpeptidase ErfK/SrfK